MENKQMWMQQGWECPKCGAVMSPTTSVCVNCKGHTDINVSVNGCTTKLKNEWIGISRELMRECSRNKEKNDD